MSEAVQASLPRRIAFTPLRDVVRGRFTGRLDVRRRIEASALPPQAQALITHVVRRTRLWRLERVGVADELIAHFADGLAAGETVDDLIGSFGDERRAARLIGRAKRRGRPILWRVLRAAGWLLVAAVVSYAALGLYFHIGRPHPATDYLAKLNAPAVKAPADDRAWPAYRAALLKMEGRTERDPRKSLSRLLDVRPGAKLWPQAAAWLERHADDVLEPARRASSRPALGFVLGPAGDANDRALWPDVSSPAFQSWLGQTRAYELYQPHLTDLRLIAGALAADAALARERGDRQRVVRDIAAIDDLASQVAAADGLWISQITAVGIRWTAVQEMARTLAAAPALLQDADLRDLAHRLGRPRTAADLFSLSGERMRFEDLLQQTFTDDGHGDGRLTPAGVDVLARVRAGWLGLTGTPGEPWTVVANPAALLLTAGRAEQRRTYERIAGAMQATLQRPLRESGRSPGDDELEAIAQSPAQSARYAPVLMVLPQMHSLRVTAERYLALRDGVLVGVALELHSRRAGQYPSSLSELVPGLLPEAPLDPVTGSPLKFVIKDGRPLVYSVGADGDDDGGRVPVRGRDGVPTPWAAAPSWPAGAAEPPADGDWVVYPDADTSADPWGDADDADAPAE